LKRPLALFVFYFLLKVFLDFRFFYFLFTPQEKTGLYYFDRLSRPPGPLYGVPGAPFLLFGEGNNKMTAVNYLLISIIICLDDFPSFLFLAFWYIRQVFNGFMPVFSGIMDSCPIYPLSALPH